MHPISVYMFVLFFITEHIFFTSTFYILDDCLEEHNTDQFEIQAKLKKCTPHKSQVEKWKKENCETVKKTAFPKCFDPKVITLYNTCLGLIDFPGNSKNLIEIYKQKFAKICHLEEVATAESKPK